MTEDHDWLDQAARQTEAWTIQAVEAVRADIPEGKPGNCLDCDGWDGRLVDGICVQCRELIEQKNKVRL